MSTPVNACISPRSLDTLSAMPSVSIPASSAAVLDARRYMVNVLSVVPTFSGLCTTSFMAATIPMLCSILLPAAARAAADRVNASPMPLELMAYLLPTSLNWSTIFIESSAATPNAFMVEMTISVASEIFVIPSPTFLYISAASPSLAASSTEKPSLAKSAVALMVSDMEAPIR